MKTCTVAGCDKPFRARGMCSGHYYHWHKENGGPFYRTVKDRLFLKIEHDEETGCWLWTGAAVPTGYGKINIGGNYVPTHRAMYELLAGPIPEGLVIDHLCRNPPCCNPGHLEPVTVAENTRRGIWPPPSPTCRRGHEYTTENTYRTPSNPKRRACRTCKLERERKRRRSARAA